MSVNPMMNIDGAILVLRYAGPILFQERDTTHIAPPIMADNGVLMWHGMSRTA